MNQRVTLLLLFHILPGLLLVLTLVGYYIERYTPYVEWDGTQTVYTYTQPEIAYQHFIDGMSFVAFFFVVTVCFSIMMLHFYNLDCKANEE